MLIYVRFQFLTKSNIMLIINLSHILYFFACKGTKIFGDVQIICNFFVWSPQRAMLEWGEQRPWSPADLIGVPRELRSNGERRSDGALYFGMPKSFSEVRDDEGYLPLRPKCRMRSTAVPLRNAQSPQEQVVRSEAKIRKVRRNFSNNQILKQRASSIITKKT